MSDLVVEVADFIREKGFENVKTFVNFEQDTVATFDYEGRNYLLSIEEIL